MKAGIRLSRIGTSFSDRARSAVAGGLLLVLCPVVGLAQDPPPPFAPDTAAVLTLDQALETARRANPELAQARNAVTRAAADRLERTGLLLPSIEASSNFSTAHTRRFTTTDVFGDPTAREQAVESTTRGSSQSIGLSMALFDGGERWTGLWAAGARREAAEADADARWAEIRARVANAYFTLMERREATEVERALLEARVDDVERTEALFRVVAADQIDVLGARIEAARQEAALAAAVEAAERAELEVGRAMGTGGGVEDRLVVPFEPFDPGILDANALIEDALASHPEVARLAAERRAAAHEKADEGWLAYLPSVNASLGYGRSEFGDSDQPFFELDPRNTSWDFRLSLSLPLFDGFRREADRTRARLAAEDAAEALRGRQLDVEAEVRGRWLDLRDAWRQLELEEATVAMARDRVELAREKYGIGAIDFIRLQEVVEQATAAERGLVRGRYEWYRALVELERAVGRPLEGAE